MADDIELKIARAIVEDAINFGYKVSVYEGGDWALKRSETVETIMAALQSTDEDTLHFRDRESDVHEGWVTLIWGNGWDLIADSTANDVTDLILARGEKIADAAQEEG